MRIKDEHQLALELEDAKEEIARLLKQIDELKQEMATMSDLMIEMATYNE